MTYEIPASITDLYDIKEPKHPILLNIQKQIPEMAEKLGVENKGTQVFMVTPKPEADPKKLSGELFIDPSCGNIFLDDQSQWFTRLCHDTNAETVLKSLFGHELAHLSRQGLEMHDDYVEAFKECLTLASLTQKGYNDTWLANLGTMFVLHKFQLVSVAVGASATAVSWHKAREKAKICAQKHIELEHYCDIAPIKSGIVTAQECKYALLQMPGVELEYDYFLKDPEKYWAEIEPKQANLIRKIADAVTSIESITSRLTQHDTHPNIVRRIQYIESFIQQEGK